VRLQPPITGPIYNIASSVLKSRPEYEAWRLGCSSRAEFCAFLDRVAPELISAGLPAEDVQFAKRYPRSESDFVSEVLLNLASRGVVPRATHDPAVYDELAGFIYTQYQHGDFRTYIYPEEARLLFHTVEILQPTSAIFLGSYYGYWAAPSAVSIASRGGRIVLVDPDPRAQALAAINIERLGIADAVEVAVATAQDYLEDVDVRFDFVALDAEGPRTHPDPEQRGKRIYAPLLRHVLPHLTPDACLACHNILFEDIAKCSYFDRIITRNRDELGPFLHILMSEFPNFTECTSTEGVGIGRRSASCLADLSRPGQVSPRSFRQCPAVPLSD
jgi:predicted O-methyltransferase YrrM